MTIALAVVSAGCPGVAESRGGSAAQKLAGDRTLNVAFMLARGPTVIDFTGPWEVFQDVMVHPDGRPFQFNLNDGNMSDMRMPFTLYTVAEKKELVRASGGLQINVSMSPQSISVAGGSLPHNNMPPYLRMTFIIALQGIFPARL